MANIVKTGLRGSVFTQEDGIITINKMARMGSGSQVAGVGEIAVSPSCGTWSTNSFTHQDVTNLWVTITTTGNPVDVYLVGDDTGNRETFIEILDESTSSYPTRGEFRIVRDSTVISAFEPRISAGDDPWGALKVGDSVTSIQTTDRVAAGTYTYKIQARSSSSATDYYAKIFRAQLIAVERR